MWRAKQNISQAGKGVFPRFLLMSLRKILETFIRFFSPSFKRKYVHTFVHTVACTNVFVGPAGFVFNAYVGRNTTCPLPFQLFQQKRWSRGRFNCISTLACKGPVCVVVLTNFYGRFFVEVGQLINSKSFHLGRHFFSFADSASLWRVQSWKRVFRKPTTLPGTVSAWSA